MMKLLKHYLQIEGPLFVAVQQQQIFSDCKTFVDCIPRHSPDVILQQFQREKDKNNFDLTQFIHQHFELPPQRNVIDFEQSATMEAHIKTLWSALTCHPDDHQSAHSSLISLPYSYIIPGGRFREIYYWDTYFTAEGLVRCDHFDLILSLAKNLAYLIETVGHVPNGNRVYYRSRSQPPFFNCLIDIIACHQGIDAIKPFLNALESEYQFWMDGREKLTEEGSAYRRIVRLDNHLILNRYWDDLSLPRPESYREDILLYSQANEAQRQHLYRNIRATCESGWDFSSRWMRDKNNLTSLYTTELIPVDLNALLYHMEIKLSDYFLHFNERDKFEFYKQRAKCRKQAIDRYCWDDHQQFYFDYCWTEKKITPPVTLAATYPLFFKLASPHQAAAVAQKLKNHFLYPGGLVTTLNETHQQWDKPNGWAPLHWIAIKGLLNYGYDDFAKLITERWLSLNREVFQRTGKMMEKYNVCDRQLEAGGGEYPLQDGFGWTNGIAIALSTLFH